jgi:hypothetical protein
MLQWLQDLESLEAISQSDETRRIFVRMAELTANGRLGTFINEVQRDEDLDDTTKGRLTEIASDESFVLAVDEYLRRTGIFH